MKKVKAIHYDEEAANDQRTCATGIVYELEDGTLLKDNDSGMVEPLTIVKPANPTQVSSTPSKPKEGEE